MRSTSIFILCAFIHAHDPYSVLHNNFILLIHVHTCDLFPYQSELRRKEMEYAHNIRYTERECHLFLLLFTYPVKFTSHQADK